MKTLLASGLLLLNIIAPPNAEVGQPVIITTESDLPQTHLWRVTPSAKGDVLLQLFDANGKPVVVYWSLVPGLKQIEVVSAVCDKSDNHSITLSSDTANLLLGTEPEPEPDPLPEPEPSPTPEYKAKVAPLVGYVSGVKIDNVDAKEISTFYSDFASVVSQSNLANTAQFRQAYIEAGRLSISHLKNKYSGLGATIDGILTKELGKDIAPLNKVELSLLLRAIAWGIEQ